MLEHGKLKIDTGRINPLLYKGDHYDPFEDDMVEAHLHLEIVSILKDKHGCCVSSSAAFAYTAVELGYTNVSLCCDGEHSWVDIDGRLYDLIFAKNKSFELNYDAEYTDYRAHPVISKRID